MVLDYSRWNKVEATDTEEERNRELDRHSVVTTGIPDNAGRVMLHLPNDQTPEDEYEPIVMDNPPDLNSPKPLDLNIRNVRGEMKKFFVLRNLTVASVTRLMAPTRAEQANFEPVVDVDLTYNGKVLNPKAKLAQYRVLTKSCLFLIGRGVKQYSMKMLRLDPYLSISSLRHMVSNNYSLPLGQIELRIEGREASDIESLADYGSQWGIVSVYVNVKELVPGFKAWNATYTPKLELVNATQRTNKTSPWEAPEDMRSERDLKADMEAKYGKQPSPAETYQQIMNHDPDLTHRQDYRPRQD